MVDSWEIVNDGVMGGCSQSTFLIDDHDCAVFKGYISLENNGGFASVRRRIPLDIEAYTQIHLNVKGDGKRYCFRLRTESKQEGTIHRFSYDYRFDTQSDIWTDYKLPLSGFRPYFRGRALSNVPPFDCSAIRQYGFLISDRQEGPFKIKISSIKAIKY